MARTRFSIAGLMGFVVLVAVGVAGLKAASPLWASSCYTLALVCLAASLVLSIQTRGRPRAFWVGFSILGWTHFGSAFVLNGSVQSNSPPLLTAVLFQQAESFFFPDQSTLSITYSYLPPTSAVVPLPPPPSITPPTPPTPARLIVGVTSSSGSSVPGNSNASVSGTLNGMVMPVTPVAAPGIVTPPTPIAISGAAPRPLTFLWQTPQMNFQQIGQSLATLVWAYVGGLFSLFVFTRQERNEANPAPGISPSSP